MNVDKVFIKGLTVYTVIGMYEWEKEFKQPLHLDVELTTNFQKASETDDIEGTVDYKHLSDELIRMTEQQSFDLIETLGERLCQHIFQCYPSVQSLKLTIHKPQAVPQAQSVGVELTRSR